MIRTNFEKKIFDQIKSKHTEVNFQLKIDFNKYTNSNIGIVTFNSNDIIVLDEIVSFLNNKICYALNNCCTCEDNNLFRTFRMSEKTFNFLGLYHDKNKRFLKELMLEIVDNTTNNAGLLKLDYNSINTLIFEIKSAIEKEEKYQPEIYHDVYHKEVKDNNITFSIEDDKSTKASINITFLNSDLFNLMRLLHSEKEEIVCRCKTVIRPSLKEHSSPMKIVKQDEEVAIIISLPSSSEELLSDVILIFLNEETIDWLLKKINLIFISNEY